jgi:hypothetical protein
MAHLFKQVVIPQTLYNDIQGLAISNIQKDKCLHFIDLLITASNRAYGLPYCFTYFGKEYFLTAFNSKYQNFIRPLKESGIIECDEVFSPEGGKSHYYRVDKDYFLSDGEPIKVQVKYKALDYDQSSEAIQNTIDFIKGLYIPYNDLYQALKQKLYDTIHKEYLENYGIKEALIKVFDGNKKYYINRDKAIAKATKLGTTLFEDEREYFIMDKAEYRKIKLHNIKCSYVSTIENLRKGNIYASRNRTNNRLDSNLTNMAGCLYEVIAKANNLKQVDAVNSQYAILGDIMKKDGIIGQFITDAENGVLYEKVVEKLNLNDRDTAKKGLMQIIFAPVATPNHLKKGLESIYPELIKYTDKVKTEKGYKHLSIMLQNHESYMYVDGFSKGLQDMGISCTTKHDSVICRESDLDKVEDYIRLQLLERDFKCQLKAS